MLRQLYAMNPPYANSQPSTTPVHPVTGRHPRWYRGPIVRGMRIGLCVISRRARGVRSWAYVLLAGTSAVLARGVWRRSAGHCRRTFGHVRDEGVHASFPAAQSIARPTSFELAVQNTGTHTVPSVAVTVDSFDYSSNYAELADNKRPIWVVERGPGAIAKPPVESQEVSIPGGGQTAYVNTWALGALAPGKTREFTWHVTPVKAGLLHGPLHGRRRARGQRQGAPGLGRSSARAVRREHQAGACAHPREPQHGSRRNRPVPGESLAASRRCVAAAPAAAAAAFGLLSKSEHLRFRHRVIPFSRAWHYDCLRLCPRRSPLAGGPNSSQEESTPLMPRTRQQNVTAAQWSANGTALGSPDLTLADNQVFGANVFSPAVQRHRLPKHVYKALQRTLARGEALDTSLADAVAQAMKEWAMEKGATHYTHWFQPLTGSTAEKHDSFYGPAATARRSPSSPARS